MGDGVLRLTDLAAGAGGDLAEAADPGERSAPRLSWRRMPTSGCVCRGENKETLKEEF